MKNAPIAITIALAIAYLPSACRYTAEMATGPGGQRNAANYRLRSA